MKLALYFTRGVSLKLWVDAGLFDREKLIYEEHLKQSSVSKVCWFTYGCNDREIANKLKEDNRLHCDIQIYDMPKLFSIPKVGSWIYAFILPLVHYKSLKKCDILKTNQIDGSWSAVISKFIFNKPLIIRTGYTVTQLYKNTNRSRFMVWVYGFIERFAYKNSDVSVVSSVNNSCYIESRYALNNVIVMRNFVDTKRFFNMGMDRSVDRLLFVGRLNKEKNLFNLFDAVSRTKFSIDVYGQGEIKDELVTYANRIGAKVRFKGVVANDKLPKIFNSYKFYILPSLFEGMPKALLEAMSCGCVCIGTDINGINEVIDSGVNGILSKDTSSDALYEVISQQYEDCYLNSLVSKGVENINNFYSLESVVKQEKALFEEMIK